MFNSDNCHGDNFHYTTLERMLQAVDFWLDSYAHGYFVRWTILHGQEPIGTVELFHREAADAFNHHGLLRLDLRSDWETVPAMVELLALLHRHAYDLFGCEILATKAPGHASARQQALREQGYIPSASLLMGWDGTEYGDYWVRARYTKGEQPHRPLPLPVLFSCPGMPCAPRRCAAARQPGPPC